MLDDVLGDEDDEEESDKIVSQVMDELGLQLTDGLAGVAVPTDSVSDPAAAGNKNKKAVAAATEDGGGETLDADADLQARLDDLRRE